MIRSFVASPVFRRSVTAARPSATIFASNNNSVLSVRGYRGDAGEALHKLSDSEEALLKVAKPKADEIYAKHVELPENGTDIAARRKRLIYRSKQRGWLEVDLLLGTWYVLLFSYFATLT
jgi:hypothetical protein